MKVRMPKGEEWGYVVVGAFATCFFALLASVILRFIIVMWQTQWPLHVNWG